MAGHVARLDDTHIVAIAVTSAGGDSRGKTGRSERRQMQRRASGTIRLLEMGARIRALTRPVHARPGRMRNRSSTINKQTYIYKRESVTFGEVRSHVSFKKVMCVCWPPSQTRLRAGIWEGPQTRPMREAAFVRLRRGRDYDLGGATVGLPPFRSDLGRLLEKLRDCLMINEIIDAEACVTLEPYQERMLCVTSRSVRGGSWYTPTQTKCYAAAIRSTDVWYMCDVTTYLAEHIRQFVAKKDAEPKPFWREVMLDVKI